MENNILRELELLVSSSALSKAKIAEMLRTMAGPKEKRQRAASVPKAPVTLYTEIKRNYTCLHCGHQFSSTVQLRGEEEVAVIKTDGKVQVLTAKSPAEISCITSSCAWCKDYVATLSREQLEENYIKLLGLVAVGGNPLYGQNLTIVHKEVKVRW